MLPEAPNSGQISCLLASRALTQPPGPCQLPSTGSVTVSRTGGTQGWGQRAGCGALPAGTAQQGCGVAGQALVVLCPFPLWQRCSLRQGKALSAAQKGPQRVSEQKGELLTSPAQNALQGAGLAQTTFFSPSTDMGRGCQCPQNFLFSSYFTGNKTCEPVPGAGLAHGVSCWRRAEMV